MSSSAGKIENSRDSVIFMLIRRIIRAADIFKIIITSSKNGLKGIIRSSTITTTNIDIP